MHPLAGVAGALRLLERLVGADRRGRSRWVWSVPVGTMLATVAMATWVGVAGQMGLVATIPLALVCGAFMFGMSAVYLAGDDDGVDEGGDGGRGPEDPSPPDPPPTPVPAWLSTPHEPAAREPEVETAGAGRGRSSR